MGPEAKKFLVRAPSAATRRAAWGALLFVGLALPAGAQPQWETAIDHPTDPKYVAMPYEVVFVATKVVESPSAICPGLPEGDYEIGTDVIGATRPSAGNSLWVVTRTGEVKKLFPLPVHESILVTHPGTGQQVPLIDTPVGQLDKGSVVEPNVSEDGQRVTFGYFHDPTLKLDNNFGNLSLRGADLYVMDMSALIADPATDPSLLPVKRLTFKIYNADGSQASADKNKNAMNLLEVNSSNGGHSGNNGWGTVYLHGVEMRTADGLKLVYVSGEKRLMNSNDQRGHSNYNLNLHIADLEADGSLGPSRQFQYYTTTSALSPTPLPNGIAFSYQGTTADGRNWQIQRIDSVGRWAPLIGYGTNDDLFHLGSYCVATQSYNGDPAGDYFLATRYYNENNNGFGGLWKINLAETGINTYDDFTQWGVKPKQKSARKLSPLVTDNDYPSNKNGAGQFYGKMTSPRCGRADELFFAYTPTSANHKSGYCSSDGRGIYHAYIGFRAGFGTFDPTAVWSPTNNNGVRVLVDDSEDFYTLAWPVPLLSWQERTGNAKQAFSNTVIDRRSPILPGEPFAQVGTSAIYNTDRRTYDCWLGGGGGGQPYNPNYNATGGVNGVNGNQRVQILNNFDAVTKVLQTGGAPDFCKPLTKEDVLGIQVNITSNKINHDCCEVGYETDGAGELETARLLGVYDVRAQSDASFLATIPSHVPFEFHLLDAEYGMRLVDVRSWHSLQPRETRTNCGGCHQHVEGAGISFAGTVASSQPPLDMVTQTHAVSYDGSCNPILLPPSSTATQLLPEWKLDIWPGFQTYCSSCHTGSGSGTAVFAYTGEQSAYNTLRNKHFADPISGALGSPAFWAARGERTDGRNNALYAATNPPFKFSAVHATTPGLCAQGDTVKAGWVHKLGQWIDNHMPRTTSGNFAAQYDTYHPTVDGAYSNAACDGTKLRVGYWDDSGFLDLVQVFENGVLVPNASWGPNEPNGSRLLTGLSITATDVIKVYAEDDKGNRQWYEKTGKQLKKDCQWKFLLVEEPIPAPHPLP